MVHRPRRVKRSGAGRRARNVVGLYGDPEATWGIGLELSVESLPARDAVVERALRLVEDHPHLGEVRVEEVGAEEDWPGRRAELVATPYLPGDALVRVGLRPADGALVVAAHHGVCDGLGLVALASGLTGLPIRSEARGIGPRRSSRSFFRRSVGRVVEALRNPPPHFTGTEGREAVGSEVDHLSVIHLPRQTRGTAAMCCAVERVFHARGLVGDPLVVVGASRRTDSDPQPDRQTAYLRITIPPGASVTDVRRNIAETVPEPDFPETSLVGLGPRLVRLLRSRLGSTAAISNLGVLSNPHLGSAAMYAAPSGPNALVIGMASSRHLTTMTLRARASEFSATEVNDLLRDLAQAFVADQVAGQVAGQ